MTPRGFSPATTAVFTRAARPAIVTLCLVAALLAPSPLRAQSATNTSAIEGRVVDESGAALPGVTVTIASPALQTPQLDAQSDEGGRYRFTALPRGIYTLTFTLSGFQKITRTDVNIDAGFVATVDIRLAVGQIEENITVTGQSPVIDVRTTTVTSNIKKEVLETLPTSRSYEDMGKLAPGVRVSGIPDVGGNHTGGGRGSLVNYGSSNGGSTLMLDGVNTDGTAGYYDMGAVDEMIVNPSGNDPEIPTPGMAFQVIIKSGGNTFHGDGLYAFQTRGLQGDNIDDRLRALGVSSGNPMDRYYDLNGSLGGRIVQDRLWFFGSGRRKEYRQELIGFAGGPGPDNLYYTADDEQGLTVDRENNAVAKFQSHLSNGQTLSYMRHYDYKKQDNRAGGAFIPHESAGDYELPNTVHVAEYTNALTSRSLLRLAIGQSYWNSRADPYTDNAPGFDNVTQRYSGAYVNSVGNDSTPAGSFSSRWQYRRQLLVFQAVIPRRRPRAEGRRRVHPRVVQQVPGSARRGHRRRRPRLSDDLLERHALPGAFVQLSVRGEERCQLSERVRARHAAYRRSPHGQRGPAHGTLPRVSAAAVQTGRSIFGRRRLRSRRALRLARDRAAVWGVVRVDRR